MRVVVVGAGVMGLPTARVLAERGHDVMVIDRFGIGNAASSSPGPTRIWRLAHDTRPMVRLARRAVAGWRALEERTGRQLLLESGLLWRGADAAATHDALRAEGVVAELVDVDRQRELFPELRPVAERPVLWQPEAGAVLAADALAAEARLLVEAGGLLVAGERVVSVQTLPAGVRVVGDRGELWADVAVIAAGAWSSQLLAQLGVHVPLTPVLEQVSYVTGPDGWENRPATVDGFGTDDAWFYGMPTPGVGYKLGIDRALRGWSADDLDRTPDPERVAETEQLVASEFPGFDPTVVRSEVCSWTSSPDERFILDRVGNVVLACGDSGQGFKFLPLFGTVLADLAEGRAPDPDVATFGLARFS